MTISLTVTGTPVVTTTIFSLLNGTNAFEIRMSPEKNIELVLDGTVVEAGAPCNDGRIALTMTRQGEVQLVSSNNSINQISSYSLNFGSVPAFISGLVGIPLESKFDNSFGLKDLSVYKNAQRTSPPPTVQPIIALMDPATPTALKGSVSNTSDSNTFIAQPGYNLYLTLTGTWDGTVVLQHTQLGSGVWSDVTGNGGTPIGTYITNCDEVVLKVTDPNARYRLKFTLTSGTVHYRLAQ